MYGSGFNVKNRYFISYIPVSQVKRKKELCIWGTLHLCNDAREAIFTCWSFPFLWERALFTLYNVSHTVWSSLVARTTEYPSALTSAKWSIKIDGWKRVRSASNGVYSEEVRHVHSCSNPWASPPFTNKLKLCNQFSIRACGIASHGKWSNVEKALVI